MCVVTTLSDRQSHPAAIHKALAELRTRMLELEARHEREIADDPDETVRSARNLVHYIALREGDLRPLQRQLVAAGLSSLGRCEAWVLGSVESALHAAARLCDPLADPIAPSPAALSLSQGRAMLDARTDALFGPRPQDRAVRMMVTMPDEAATDEGFIPGCLARGMDMMRINTAAGRPADWQAMIGRLADAGESGRGCRVLADLAGPKIRIASMIRKGEPVDRARLREGDSVRVAARPDEEDASSRFTFYAEPAEVLSNAEPGHAVWFDDGKVGAEVAAADDRGVRLRVTFTKPGGQRLRIGKGLNLPDTPVDIPSLTDDDRATLRALWGKVDTFALSFVRSPSDVRDLREACESLQAELGGPFPALVVKIETRAGFESLPAILLELLRVPVCGVMLARGDLAVECGFERMAEIQEELLCFCEAAHVPVIWATDVLGTLAKLGRPTRAEITDAAVAQRAECVMLNKGPEIHRALSTLADILRRMQRHQRKKTPTFHPLSIAVLPEPA